MRSFARNERNEKSNSDSETMMMREKKENVFVFENDEETRRGEKRKILYKKMKKCYENVDLFLIIQYDN
jgi:hypothetical protein